MAVSSHARSHEFVNETQPSRLSSRIIESARTVEIMAMMERSIEVKSAKFLCSRVLRPNNRAACRSGPYKSISNVNAQYWISHPQNTTFTEMLISPPMPDYIYHPVKSPDNVRRRISRCNPYEYLYCCISAQMGTAGILQHHQL